MSNKLKTLASINHVAISVGDKSIAEMVEWYSGTFSCEVVWQDSTWALLKFANVNLALVTPGQHPPHLGFEIPDAESFGELDTHRDGTRSVYISDPAGNDLEMMTPADF